MSSSLGFLPTNNSNRVKPRRTVQLRTLNNNRCVGWKQGTIKSKHGDCFFESLSVCLRNPAADAGAATVVTASQLREVMLTDLTMSSAAVAYWREVLKVGDAQTQSELAFASPLLDQNLSPELAMANLKRNMAQPSLYWGDHFAVRTLSKMFQVNIIVTTPCSSSAQTLRHPRTVILSLQNSHYEPLVHNCSACFQTQSDAIQNYINCNNVIVRS